MLKRFIDVFRQCKQLLNNKILQFVSIIKSNLINKFNTIYKESYLRNLYILRRFFLFVIFVVEHVELYLFCLLLNISNFVCFVCCQICRTRLLACRAMFACQVVEHANNRAIYYRLLYRVYTSYNELGS